MMMEASRQLRQTKERMGNGNDDDDDAGSIILGYTYAVRIPSLPPSSTLAEQSLIDEKDDGGNDESCIIVEGGVPFSSKKTVKPNIRIDMNDDHESRPIQPLKSITSRRRSRCKEEADEEEEEVDDDVEEEEEDDDDDDEPFTTTRSNDDDTNDEEEEEEDEEEGDDDDDDVEPFTTARSNDDNDDEEEGEEEDDVEPFTTVRSNDDNDNNAYIILRVNEEEDITTTVSNDILREGIRDVNAYAAYDKDDDEDIDNDDDDDDLSTHVMFDEVDGRGWSSSSPEDSRPILLKSATSLTSLRSSLLSAGKNNAFHQLQSLSKRLSSSGSNNTRRNSTTRNNVTNKEYWLRKNCHHLLDHIDNQEDNTVISVIHPVVGERGEGTEDKDENTMEMVFYETY